MLFKDGICSIYHPQRGKIAKLIMSPNRLFILSTKPSTTKNEGRCLQVSDMDQSTLWHHCYGHLGYKGLCTLKHKNTVKGLPQIVPPNTTCEACMKGKQHRTPFPKMGKWKATKKLGLVHADLCGSISPTSSGQKKYLCLIDEFSRKAWSYFQSSGGKGNWKAYKMFKNR